MYMNDIYIHTLFCLLYQDSVSLPLTLSLSVLHFAMDLSPALDYVDHVSFLSLYYTPIQVLLLTCCVLSLISVSPLTPTASRGFQIHECYIVEMTHSRQPH